jgi:xanthine/uracil permease
MAGHVRFSARTGGSLVILGAVLLIVAVFFSSSMATFLRLFPSSIVGVILFLTGAQLALGSCEISTILRHPQQNPAMTTTSTSPDPGF